MCLILAFALAYLHKLGENETRPKFIERCVECECSSDFCIQEMILTTLSILFYCSFSAKFTNTFLFIILILEVYLGQRALVLMPKYNELVNKTLISTHFVLAFVAVAFLLGRLLNSAAVTVILGVIILPVTIYLSCEWIYKLRKDKLVNPTLDCI